MKKIQYFLWMMLVFVGCERQESLPPSPERLIRSFSLEEGQFGDAQITVREDGGTIRVQVFEGANLKQLRPRIELSKDASISPQVSTIDVSETRSYRYRVTSATGLDLDWDVFFEVLSVAEYGTYVVTDNAQSRYLSVLGDTLFNQKYTDDAMIGTEVLAFANNIPRHQKWHFIRQQDANGSDVYQIRNLHSGKLLTALGDNAGAADALGQRSVLVEDQERQWWRLENTGELGQRELINVFFSASVGVLDGQQWIVAPIAADAYRDDVVCGFFNRNNPAQGAVAFDQGNSIPLTWGPNNGKVIWVTQDAWDGSSLRENSYFPCGYFFSYGNSMLLQPSKNNWDNLHTPNLTVPHGANGRPRQVTTILPGHTFSWPGMGVEIGDKVYVQCGEGVGLGIQGQSLYVFQQNAGTEWDAYRTVPNGLADYTDIAYSAGMVKADDGYVYVFGTESLGFGYQNYVHVARFPQSNPQDWSYYDGISWTSTPTKGAGSKIGDGLGTITVSYLSGKYILLTMDQGFNCDANRNVYMAVSDSPTGPFTERKLVYTINEYFYGQYARFYTPALHPHFDNGRQELLFTYSLNYSACGLGECQEGIIDPYFYRIKAVRVPYSMIGL